MRSTLTYLYLGIAIVSEVIATSALKVSERFSHPIPSILTIIGYGVAFWFLSLTLEDMSTGIAYAIWSAAGIVLIAAVSWVWFNQSLDIPGIIGLSLIIFGVIIVNLFSKSVNQ